MAKGITHIFFAAEEYFCLLGNKKKQKTMRSQSENNVTGFEAFAGILF